MSNKNSQQPISSRSQAQDSSEGARVHRVRRLISLQKLLFSRHLLKQNLRRYLLWSIYSFICGILAGTAAAVFLLSLSWATQTREEFPLFIWALPLAGFFIA